MNVKAVAPLPNLPPAALKGAQFAIHADGGGLRAALFTAEVLALADDLSCGDFGSHVFAASGVSGGSLGIATWAVMRAELTGDDPWADCKQLREKAGVRESHSYWNWNNPSYRYRFFPLWFSVLNTLSVDHLTAALTSTLTTDLLWRGGMRRGPSLTG